MLPAIHHESWLSKVILKNRSFILFRLLTLAWLAAVFSACNPHIEPRFFAQSSSGNLNAEQILAYRTTFYAFAKSQGCVKCHESSISPHFASLDINEAYLAARGFRNGSTTIKLIDFDLPVASTFVDYAGNSHCSDTPCSDPDIRPLVQDALEMWAASEIAVGHGGSAIPQKVPRFFTASLKVPATIPTIFTNVPAVLRFPLSDLKPKVPALEGAILEIEIQMVNANSYRLSKPKIAGNAISVAFKELSVFIKATDDPLTNGREDISQALNWHAVDATAAVFALPATLPAAPLTAVPLAGLPIYFQTSTQADYFTVGFGDIK